MDGLAYDCDRGIILKTTTNGKLLQYDAFSRKFLGYANVPSIHVGITYVPKIHMLVGEEGGKFFFYKYYYLFLGLKPSVFCASSFNFSGL